MKTCFIVSHNKRIRCLLNSIQPYFKSTVNVNVKFQKCAILKLILGPSQASLSMFYSGEISNEIVSVNNPYYVKDETNIPGYVTYPSTEAYENNVSQICTVLKLKPLKEIYTFYLIQNAESEDNIKKKYLGMNVSTMGMVSDSSITKEGEKQSMRAGEYIKSVIGTNNDTFFVSDLKKSYQTAEIMKQIINNNKMSIVLPCASEISELNIGNCDVSSLITKFTSENYSSCKIHGRIYGTSESCEKRIDWKSIYLPFYGGIIRGEHDTLLRFRHPSDYYIRSKHCRDTSMIAMAIYYLSYFKNDRTNEQKNQDFNKYMSHFGGTKKRRFFKKKTRK